MKSILITALAICAYTICNWQLQAMDKPNSSIDVLITRDAQFACIMELATNPDSDHSLLDQAIKTAMASKRTSHFQEKMNLVLVKALDNEKINSKERSEIFKKHGISFNIVLKEEKTLLHRYAIIPQTVIWLLQNTDIDVNKQDNKGNTVAHYFAQSSISICPLLVDLFNTFISKNINPLLKNHKGKTAKNIALKEYDRYKDYGHTRHANKYKSCADLFDQLEAEFNHQAQRFLIRLKVILSDRGNTIELVKRW